MIDLIQALVALAMFTGLSSGAYAFYYLVNWNYRLHKRGMLSAMVSGAVILILSFLVKIIYIFPAVG